jgi:hypothetical protein
MVSLDLHSAAAVFPSIGVAPASSPWHLCRSRRVTVIPRRRSSGTSVFVSIWVAAGSSVTMFAGAACPSTLVLYWLSSLPPRSCREIWWWLHERHQGSVQEQRGIQRKASQTHLVQANRRRHQALRTHLRQPNRRRHQALNAATAGTSPSDRGHALNRPTSACLAGTHAGLQNVGAKPMEIHETLPVVRIGPCLRLHCWMGSF